MIYDEIWIDINKFESGYAVAARQNETNAQIKIIVTNKGEKIDNSKHSIEFLGNNPNGDLTDGKATRIYNENGTYTYNFTKENLSVAGKFKRAYFRVIDSNKKEVTSANFSLKVLPQADMTADQATIHVSKLDELLNKHDKELSDQKEEFEDYEEEQKISWKDFVNKNKELIENIDPGGILINEIIEAREDNNSLSERLNKLATNEDISITSSLLGRVDGVRNVFIDRLNDVKSLIDNKKFNMSIIFDPHFMEGSTVGGGILKDSLSHINNIMFLSDKLDCVVSGGDNSDVNAYSNSKANLINTQKQYAEYFFSLNKSDFCAIIKGNHDDGSLVAHYKYLEGYRKSNVNNFLTDEFILTDDEFSNIYHQNGDQGEIRNEKSNYFYKDFVDKKVRLICLDSSDSPDTKVDGKLKYPRQYYSIFSKKQVDWFISKALNVPDEYKVIIVTHWPINKTIVDYQEKDNPYHDYSGDSIVNHDVIKHLIDAFNSKSKGSFKGASTSELNTSVSYDFNKNNSKIIAVFSGHIHVDLVKKINNVNYVSSCCSMGLSKQYDRGQNTRNTLKEECFDVITLEDNYIRMTRVGAGNDRTFEY